MSRSNGRRNGSTTGAAPVVGMLEWFLKDERERVERVVASLRELGVRHLRTGVSWADWVSPDGADWYRWLLPRLAREFEVLPCVVYTPPSVAVEPAVSAPPRRLRDYADFLDVLIGELGGSFDTIELWNEPNNLSDWDWRLDPDWQLFAEMIGDAAHWARTRGKRTVLGGMSPLDAGWLDVVAAHGILRDIDVVGVHGFPGTWEPDWTSWPSKIGEVREVIARHGSAADVWITETGFSTWRHDEHSQVRELAEAMAAPVDRVYWYAAEDLAPDRVAVDGFHADERDYHFGLCDAAGTPKLLHWLWRDHGLERVRRVAALAPAPDRRRHRGRYALVTGGAGFVATNVADRLLEEGRRVLVLDNLSRPGVERNLLWLKRRHADDVLVEVADVRDPAAVRRAVSGADTVFHFAAQVAVTTSLESPTDDFAVNLRGTMNLLEELRRLPEAPPLLFTSTNKVYGALPDLRLVRNGDRWEPADDEVRERGIGESQPLDFSTPYGCSKGGADQYVLDYAKSFGLPATVFRMSCIYGPHQHGTEDQGWVAHFLLRALAGEPITLYGDGAQVRDVLFVSDLVEAMLLALEAPERSAGLAFNVGGGPGSAASLLEVLELIHELTGTPPQVRFAEERPGDQRWYVSDTSRLRALTGWAPRVELETGLERLDAWLRQAAAAPIAA